jgi:lysophospholipase L1-like esterase
MSVGERRRWRNVTVVVAMAALAIAMGGWRWPAAQPSPSYYLALGDSLAAGSNAPAGRGYVNDLYRHEAAAVPGLKLKNYGCPGATTTSMLQRGACNASVSQIEEAVHFARQHRGAIAFITVDIGANDAIPCIVQGVLNGSCAAAVEAALRTNMATIFGDLHSAAPGVPVVAMTYYDPYLASWVGGDRHAARSSVKAVGRLDRALSGLFSDHGATVADVEGAFQTHDFARTGFYRRAEVPENVARVCHWTSMCSTGNVHANPTGYRVIAEAFEPLVGAALQGR